jgi:hypothetical protein
MIASSRTFCWYFCWYRFSRFAQVPTADESNASMPLTDTAIRNAKPKEKAVKLSDGRGLFLLIQPNGAKLWCLAHRFAGKQKLLAFGIYPTISLSAARDRRDTAKKHLADGINPAVQQKIAKQARVITFRLVAEELLNKMTREGRAAATLTKTRWLLEFAFTSIGDRPIGKIKAHELLDVLRKIEARGNYETAHTVQVIEHLLTGPFADVVLVSERSDQPFFIDRPAGHGRDGSFYFC